ncbi:MAG: valine--tRNA ligase [Patescibacteria group bacterium]
MSKELPISAHSPIKTARTSVIARSQTTKQSRRNTGLPRAPSQLGVARNDGCERLQLPSQYNPAEIEADIYRKWDESGFFNPDKLPARHKKPFTIIMPPPNANGALHIGHAVFVTLQDIMIRFQRMRGRRTLWLPGADHAGFETQVVFDKKLEKEGRDRSGIPRDELYREMLEFSLENKKIMEDQLRKLGASCDWSRKKFTLDPDIIKKTQETFVALYDDGLVYRGERIVNWCVKHQTALADLETKRIEEKAPLYYFQYGPFVIATARPETKFGDKYVVMHPRDRRYKEYKHGQHIELEWINGPIVATVIKDEAIDMNFGTGVMTITPWHDPVDFDIAERHTLDKEQIIDRRGKLLPVAGEFAGASIKDARPLIVEKLKAKGLLIKTEEEYSHHISVCYKCSRPIEPQILPQWFLKMAPLAKKAIEAVEKGKIVFVPGRFKKIYFHWLRNIRDWNLSRQILWGIRIPAYFCLDCEGFPDGGDYDQTRQRMENTMMWREHDPQWFTALDPRSCPQCGSHKIVRDADTLDTWFSSGQWPFLALGYPDAKDYKTFYPTDVMETGWDILFFWVARMIMLGLYRTGRVPFKTVYLNGLVRDKDRQKMSKSKGNVIDPLGVAALYGTDAVRMALTVGNLPGNDIIISEDKIRGYRNFATKLWNIQRFILLNDDAKTVRGAPKFNAKDRKAQKELKTLVKIVTKDLEAFRFHHAAEKLYHYAWHTFADKIIEDAKPRIASADPDERRAALKLLIEIQTTLLKLLHPFMPFITETLWEKLPASRSKATKGLLMVEQWPE